MPTWKEVEKRYGKKTADKMKESKWLDGITVELSSNGEVDYPQRDIENAYRDITGKDVPEWMWD